MTRTFLASLGLLALIGTALPASAASPEVSLGVMPKALDVTLLNDGGKYVAIDMKHLDKGATCRMDQDALVVRVGVGAAKDTTLVRAIQPQLKSGGCPFMTEFEIGNDVYASAQKAFDDKKAAAEQKLHEMTQALEQKVWDEIFGAKPTAPSKSDTL